ncbi:MAG: WG repeat-containing protein [Saprospiraceae bacterium]|nr:WG repeat-containing protein [Saprospiraceae bacterium]
MTDGSNKNVLRSYVLADNPEALFFINDTGQVVIPPQYREVKGYKNDGYLLVENAEKRQKIVLKETGEVIDKPWRYEMALVHPKSRIMLVKDTAEITYGVVRKDGKVLKPCVNYGVALGDIETSTFFVKRDTPLIQRPPKIDFYKNGYDLISFKKDSLNIEDNDWFLHDVEGQLLNKQPFRYPFDFYKGIGIGVQGEDFNLYKTDGTILPPQYKNSKTGVPTGFNNIISIEPYNHYALFRNQGLVPTMIVTDSEGHILVESGRYDGISRFYDKYALVSAEGKIGLIDTSGREIIAPQDLRASKIALIDSINDNKLFLHNYLERKNDDFFNDYPVVINTEQFELTTESLKINEQQRTDLLNLMLDISLPDMLNHAQDMRIERNSLVAKAQFVETYSNASFPYLSLNKLSITDKFISFIYQGFRLEFGQSYNFQKVNNRWEKRTLYDIIDLRGTKQARFNSLMTQKIRAMKDITINCSEGTDFLKQVENRFILTEKGIDFCFESADWSSQLVVVSFTWEELKLL